jgi:cystathionine beta-lyase/cystathionine gamma-synthase
VKFATRAIHVGQDADPTTGATIVPIYQTSTYTQDAIGVHKGYDYSRSINPTRVALEAQLASLEEGAFGSAFASGVAASTAVLSLLDAGGHVVVSDDLYGGTYRLFSKVLSRYGIEFSFVDMTDLDAVRAAMRPTTRMLWVETPTNPMLKLIDIAAIAAVRDEYSRDAVSGRALVCVDNTFMSPYFQRPLSMGADIVVHSTTKYIGGHSDVIGGVAITNDKAIAEALKFYQNSAGAVPGPQDAFLTMRGAKTLAIRMREHAHNAQLVAEFLESRDDIDRVYYPGLPSHPQYELAKRQMRGFGGMVSLVPSGGVERSHAFAARLRFFSLAESLGGVESLISNPARMTHGAIPQEERERRGVVDGLLRLSVGIEDAEDLIEDLRVGLDATRPVAAAQFSVR